MTATNPDKFVAIGEGLAAGFGPFTLNRWSQRFSFPALIARQLGVPFPQPLFEPPGIGDAPGFEPQPVILPGISQATVFESLPPVEFANLSVPGMTLIDALERRPRSPWIMRDDPLQTACNLIVGSRRMATNAELLTQVENAASQRPAVVLIALGFTEALTAAIGASAHAPRLPGPAEFGAQYAKLAAALSPASLLMFTVPDPFDTPFFLRPDHASRGACVEETWLRAQYGVRQDDFLKLPSLHEIGFQIFGKSLRPLPPDSTVSAEAAAEISSRVAAWNAQIQNIASRRDAQVYDLHGLFRRLRQEGLAVGNKRLTADYLGGLYTLNGYYLGFTGHALIANEILDMMQQPVIDLEEISAIDPAAQIETAKGRKWTSAELSGFSGRPAGQTSPNQESTRRSQRSRAGSSTAVMTPLVATGHGPLPRRLVLPPDLKQELPLDHRGSYFGDGISANNCESPADAQFDGAGQTLFGGLAMVDSHLRGSLRFEFTPISADRASFKLFFDGLTGDDTVLTAPVMFRMPFEETGVSAYPAPFNVSTGIVDLTTGEVSKLRVYASFKAIALGALVACNKDFPSTPLSFVTLDAAVSPLEYSSACAYFEQRADGKLDFTFYGSRFVPLGPSAVWPLTFGGPEGKFAQIPAAGTVMHPHLRLTTKVSDQPTDSPNPAPIPTNCIREFTFHTHNTAFGDGFDLRIPELGGPCTGRSHIMGRAVIQFGVPSGGTIPVAVRSLPPGGIFSQPYPSPIADSFPVRLGPGPRGYDQKLRYPRATFTMEKISLPDDPFDIAMGAVDVETGRVFSDHLHRAFIEQDVINALMRIESRIRHTSFFFRGPGVFASTRTNALMFRFLGDEILPYPAGLAYPQPDFTSSFYATLGATLNPYLWIRAIEDAAPEDFVAEGNFKGIVAANRDEFSCRYRIPADPGKHHFYFHYQNNTQLGSFTLHSLAWVGFSNSADGISDAGFDTVTFSGFGIWEKNGVKSLEQVAAQIWNNPSNPMSPYIGIQVASGDISNVDLRPVDFTNAFP